MALILSGCNWAFCFQPRLTIPPHMCFYSVWWRWSAPQHGQGGLAYEGLCAYFVRTSSWTTNCSNNMWLVGSSAVLLTCGNPRKWLLWKTCYPMPIFPIRFLWQCSWRHYFERHLRKWKCINQPNLVGWISIVIRLQKIRMDHNPNNCYWIIWVSSNRNHGLLKSFRTFPAI